MTQNDDSERIEKTTQALYASICFPLGERPPLERLRELLGRIAHRFSTYEARFDLDEPKPFSVGINSIQFIRVGGA